MQVKQFIRWQDINILAGSNGVQCFYCGIKDLCELPFDEETVEKIECPYSCMKFDGYCFCKKQKFSEFLLLLKIHRGREEGDCARLRFLRR